MTNGRIRITDIFISNFRCFAPRALEAEPNVKYLSEINIFVGPNGAGKTAFTNAIRDCVGYGAFNSFSTYTIERNYQDRAQRIYVILTLDTSTGATKAVFEQDPPANGRAPATRRYTEPQLDWPLKERIFPIGLPRQFKMFNDLATEAARSGKEDISPVRIRQSWNSIRQDAARIGINLPETPPEKPRTRDQPVADDYGDRFFFDVRDTYGVPLIESSDGEANFLYMIVCIRTMPAGSVLLIEEPEVGMHPGLQKQFLDYLRELSQRDEYQFLINTHSPYLMNLASVDKTIGLFRIFKDQSGSSKIESLHEGPRSEHWQLLRDLGHSPADVMQANGIVWVEGPSDLIYVSSWLEKWAPCLRRGRDYEVMWYGGSIFTHLGTGDSLQVDENLWQGDKIQEELVDLFSLNPNWAFIVDSDSHSTRVHRTTQENKDRFIKQCQSSSPPKFTWKVEPYIEGCIKDYMDWHLPLIRDKVKWAHKYQKKIHRVAKGSVESHLTDEARSKLDALVDAIEMWRIG